MILSDALIWISIPFVLTTVYFGTKGGYYNTDKYNGDGTAHKVLKWEIKVWKHSKQMLLVTLKKQD